LTLLADRLVRVGSASLKGALRSVLASLRSCGSSVWLWADPCPCRFGPQLVKSRARRWCRGWLQKTEPFPMPCRASGIEGKIGANNGSKDGRSPALREGGFVDRPMPLRCRWPPVWYPMPS